MYLFAFVIFYCFVFLLAISHSILALNPECTVPHSGPRKHENNNTSYKTFYVKTLTSSTQHFYVVGKLENVCKLMLCFVVSLVLHGSIMIN